MLMKEPSVKKAHKRKKIPRRKWTLNSMLQLSKLKFKPTLNLLKTLASEIWKT
jgi:hypothetical protein